MEVKEKLAEFNNNMAETSASVQDEQLSSNSEFYNEEEKRLKTFNNWPAHYPVNPSRLAKSGFYYSGNGDEVTCFSCGGNISNWQYGDIVHKRHMEMYPHCKFLHHKSNNIAFVSHNTSSTPERVSSGGSDKCSNIHDKCDVQPNVCYEAQHATTLNKLSSNLKAKGILNCQNTSPATESKNVLPESSNPVIAAKRMTSLEERLETFQCGWSLESPNVKDLANAGFFYLGHGDKVQCAFCRGIVRDWDAKDVPLLEHARHFPECKYVQQLQKSTSLGSSPLKDRDVCGSSDELFQPKVPTSNYKLIDKSKQHTKLSELGINIHNTPSHPDQSTLSARLRTFLTWPGSVPVTKEALAAAGFFYIGISDYTKCFYCDGGLCSWEPGDDPWIEHARWFRNCSFLRLNKDESFIKQCVRTESPPDVNLWKDMQLPQSSSKPSENVLTYKVDEAMKSNLISAVVKTGIYPPYLIRAAVFQQLKDNGAPFANVEDVCEAVNILKEKIKATSNVKCQKKSGVGASISDVNSEKRPPSGQGSAPSGLDTDEKSRNSVPSETEDSKLEEENRFLKDQRLCKVCMDNDVSVVFLPCGHLLACTLCAPALNHCPMCRQPIQATVRAYLP